MGGTTTGLALKEWALVCSKIGSGEHKVLFRKGGLREAQFRATSQEFYLLPTTYHYHQSHLIRKEALPKTQKERDHLEQDFKSLPSIPLTVTARIHALWTTTDPAVVGALHDYHIWSDGFAESRLAWREQHPINVLLLDAASLTEAQQLPNRKDIWGCFSWVESDLPPVDTLERSRRFSPSALDEFVQDIESLCLKNGVPLKH